MAEFNTPLIGALVTVDANVLQKIFGAIFKEMARMDNEIVDLKKKAGK